MLSQARFAAMALSLPEAVQGGHFDVADFRVGGRIFATLRPKDGRAVLNLSPDQQRLLLETSGEIFESVPGSWGHKGWTNVVLASADEETVRHAMTMAWRSVAPRRLIVQV